LHVDDRLGLAEAIGQLLVLASQPLVLLHQGILGLGLAAPPLRLEGGQGAFFTLPPPSAQMRGIEPFPP